MSKRTVIVVVLLTLICCLGLASCRKAEDPELLKNTYLYKGYAFSSTLSKYCTTGDSLLLEGGIGKYTLNYANGLMDMSGRYSVGEVSKSVFLELHKDIESMFETQYESYIRDNYEGTLSEDVIVQLCESFAAATTYHYDREYIFTEDSIQCFRQILVADAKNVEYDFSGLEGVYQMPGEDYVIALYKNKVYRQDTTTTDAQLVEVGDYSVLGDFITISMVSNSVMVTARYLITYVVFPEQIAEGDALYDETLVSAITSIQGKKICTLVANFYSTRELE